MLLLFTSAFLFTWFYKELNLAACYASFIESFSIYRCYVTVAQTRDDHVAGKVCLP